LDNAPTYLSFLSVETGAFVPADTMAAIISHVKVHGGDLNVAAGTCASKSGKPCPPRRHFTWLTWIIASSIPMRRGWRYCSETLLRKMPQGHQHWRGVFRANTYIGNGPNFMVKAIADHQKAHTPTFLGYVFKFTIPYMLPMLVIVWLLFFRG